MSIVPPEVEKRLAELIEPMAGEILQAKQRFLIFLADGKPLSRVDLVSKYFAETGISERPSSRDDVLDIPIGSAAADSLDGSNPHIARERLQRAAVIALAELSDEGLLIEVDGPANVFATVSVRYGSTSGGVRIPIGSPLLASGYQIARRFQAELLPILDVDLFSADLAVLGLDDRALRCIREALEAYRRGLYLSCISLLGAVSEGAWWQLAERFRGRNKEIDEALDNGQTNAARLMKLVADEIAKIKGKKNLAAELHAHATYLRELRNYGTHPRGADPNATEEHAFGESGCSVLLLSTHRYLEKLAALQSLNIR